MTHKSHAAHHTGNNRVRNQNEIRDMVDSVIRAKFGGSFLRWLQSVRRLDGIEELPGRRIAFAPESKDSPCAGAETQ